MKDPTGFSAEMVRDEANNWTRRETGKEMLLNYADVLEQQQPDLAAIREVIAELIAPPLMFDSDRRRCADKLASAIGDMS